MEAAWYKAMRAGCTVTFWLLLTPKALTMLGTFVLAVAGGQPEHLKWCRLIHVVGAVGLAVGIVLLTTEAPPPRRRLRRSVGWLFRVVVVVDIMATCVSGAASTAGLYALLSFADGMREVNGIAFVIVGAAHIGMLARRLRIGRLEREIWIASATFVGISAIDWILAAQEPAWYTSGPFQVFGMLYALGIGGWGLSIVWRVRRVFARLVRAECIGCGYSLTGLPVARCPECGLVFDDLRMSSAPDKVIRTESES